MSMLKAGIIPTKVIRVRNKDKPRFNADCSRAFEFKQEAYLWWTRDRSRVNWDAFANYSTRANEVSPDAGRHFDVRNIAVLTNSQSPHNWRSILKSAVFGSSSSLPPILDGGGGLVCT